MDFFKKLNFSSSNEDGASEITALTRANRIVCITGSGTRPLDLLQTKAAEVIAFDVNPAQNALLELKLAALKELDHAQFLSFIGITEGPRAALYQHIRGGLSGEMQAYWDQRKRLISKGVWYAGKWEKLLYWNARILSLFRRRAVDALMEAPDVAQQSQVWATHFSDNRIRRAIEMIGRDWVWRWIMREPAGEFLPGPQAVGERLAADFESAASRFLFRDSDFATLIFRGALSAHGGLPVHLRAENYAHTKANLGRIRIVEGNLTEMRAAGINDADGFSLSDFGSYTSAEAYAACWQGIMEAAAPNARFCERVFMNDLDLPFETLREDAALSDQLTQSDMAIIYRLRAGRIAKA
jgi:S-adenosylmethionine-diacylglycerol 3-amino-3-carboxypropyl transferase